MGNIASKQPQNPYMQPSANIANGNYAKTTGTRSPEAIQWDIDNTQPSVLSNKQTGALQQELGAANQNAANRAWSKELQDAGYLDWWYNEGGGGDYGRANVLQQDWGARGSMGGIGEQGARDVFRNTLEHGKATGEWKPMADFFDAAKYGQGKYHRSGFMGTGISISPMAMMGMALGGFGALGGFTGAAAGAGAGAGTSTGLSGISGFSGTAANGFGSLTGSLGSGASSLGSLTGGALGSNLIGSGAINALSAGGNLSGLVNGADVLNAATSGINVNPAPSLSEVAPGVSPNAAIGGGGVSPSSLLSLQNAQKVAKLANSFMGGGGQEGQTPQQAQQQAQQRIPTISQASPNFRSGVQDRLNLNTNVKTKERKPFMTVQEMFNQRYG